MKLTSRNEVTFINEKGEKIVLVSGACIYHF